MNSDVGKDMNTSKLRTNCSELAKKSYDCLEKCRGDNTKCQPYFDAYKDCRKEEHTKMIAERRAKYT